MQRVKKLLKREKYFCIHSMTSWRAENNFHDLLLKDVFEKYFPDEIFFFFITVFICFFSFTSIHYLFGVRRHVCVELLTQC